MTAIAISSLEALEKEVVRFVETLTPKETEATLVTLSGELGAGKTTFTQLVAKKLGITEPVTSPTFVIEKIYELPVPRSDAGFTQLVHIDAYRLEKDANLDVLGFHELMRDPQNLILLEWPEMIPDALPAPTTHISLTVSKDGSRTLSYT